MSKTARGMTRRGSLAEIGMWRVVPVGAATALVLHLIHREFAQPPGERGSGKKRV